MPSNLKCISTGDPARLGSSSSFAYMAMHDPCAGVVGLESNDEPATGVKHSDISTSRVVVIQIGEVVLCEVSYTSAQDVEVVSMKMDRMRDVDRRCSCDLLNDPVIPFTRFCQFDEVGI